MMLTLQCQYSMAGWYVIGIKPHKGEVARFGPFTAGERDAFIQGVEAFAPRSP